MDSDCFANFPVRNQISLFRAEVVGSTQTRGALGYYSEIYVMEGPALVVLVAVFGFGRLERVTQI